MLTKRIELSIIKVSLDVKSDHEFDHANVIIFLYGVGQYVSIVVGPEWTAGFANLQQELESQKFILDIILCII